jgi:predicted CoA-substrate-specific enzyme activase
MVREKGIVSVRSASLGICAGASTIGLVKLRRGLSGPEVAWARTRAHDGNPHACLQGMLDAAGDIEGLRVGVTGRKFRHRLNFSSISEPEAVEWAAGHVFPADHAYRAIVSAGGETFMVYHLDDEGCIQGVYTGNKCASGTGEFFLQQLRRMDLSLDGMTRMSPPEHPHKVSGRCSVFCKSDCTHALNKGIPKGEVVAGLSMMMAAKVLELLARLPKTPVVLIGGAAANRSMAEEIRKNVEELHIPEEAAYFEALGAALWALEHEATPYRRDQALFCDRESSFTFLQPLSAFRDRVQFKRHSSGEARPGDRVIVGLDVGSTTTKGVVMRRSDKRILASEYLRTNGDPVGASRRVYRALSSQLAVEVEIDGLGVTGSGRQIAGLHAMTEGIVNEIVAHATAAVHFDPEVDTIFEIGGQDAKYTYLTNGVPSDYAMNEACSAGTGSFLEESAKESLGLEVRSISAMAYESRQPPNFNDQCAAFIGSDIKGAVQEGISLPDIVAGLVYSVCMNYTNRVKGNRPVGKKVFMQGGVCYNEAVPAAMAALTGREIIVPPEPGLMGALGVAIEVEHRLSRGLMTPQPFDLEALAAREAVHREPFVCAGGAGQCDRKCTIARIEIDGKIYPFGGICNRFDNLLHHRQVDTEGLNLVVERQKRVFAECSEAPPEPGMPSIGLNRSFLTNTYFPLFNRFFCELGFRVVIPREIDPAGEKRQGAAFCYPVELAHGFAQALLGMRPDYVFLPHIRGVPSGNDRENACTCVFVQGEPYYLRSAFPELDTPKTLSPFFDFSHGIESDKAAFQALAESLGCDTGRFEQAFQGAIAAQRQFQDALAALGRKALADVRQDPGRMGVVVFGRAYNSFVSEANKGIPDKFATRGLTIIPYDMLPLEEEELDANHNMYWGTGRAILQAAQYVARDPQLFGVFISNFSCGPDSFITGYFRDMMGRKPSLTLELDSHTADAGIETRIEAFLDVVHYYRQLTEATHSAQGNGFSPAIIEYRGREAGIRTENGEWFPLRHPRVKVIMPSMGGDVTEFLAKAFQRTGVRLEILPPANEEILKLGRAHTSCKECLPLQTTTGSLMHYLKTRSPDEITAYFMASTDGPCRFGQYQVFSKNLIEKQRIPSLAVISLTTANNYGGLGTKFILTGWRALILGDLFEEIRATILAGAVAREDALRIFNEERQAILDALDKPWTKLLRQVSASARRLGGIELKRPYHELPKISLVGEIYVRNDPVSLQNLVERLSAKGFVVRTSKMGEWMKYLDWLVLNGVKSEVRGLGFWLRFAFKAYMDGAVRKRLRPAGLFFYEKGEVDPVVRAGSRFISPKLTGEAILTVGAALHEMLHPACGVISIGPFGCMPSRVAESILGERLTTEVKRALHDGDLPREWEGLLAGNRKLPFLAIETDGNLFPQLIEARLEAFTLQAQRLNDRMLQERALRKD